MIIIFRITIQEPNKKIDQSLKTKEWRWKIKYFDSWYNPEIYMHRMKFSNFWKPWRFSNAGLKNKPKQQNPEKKTIKKRTHFSQPNKCLKKRKKEDNLYKKKNRTHLQIHLHRQMCACVWERESFYLGVWMK